MMKIFLEKKVYFTKLEPETLEFEFHFPEVK